MTAAENQADSPTHLCKVRMAGKAGCAPLLATTRLANPNGACSARGGAWRAQRINRFKSGSRRFIIHLFFLTCRTGYSVSDVRETHALGSGWLTSRWLVEFRQWISPRFRASE